MLYSISTAGVAKRGNKYFVAKRKPGNSIGDLWEFPGGKADKGEKPESALKREFLEEFNVQIDVGKKICSGIFTNNSIIYKLIAFSIDILSDNLQLNEHTDTAWVEKEKFTQMNFPKSDMIIVNFIMNNC
ncbi:MAG: NUDIX domain-containing protein [Spirochaetia bacterium]|jgi:mutator protein MutT|nr:NUDIX domain-containing protein [Spirochaetia bacterium]